MKREFTGVFIPAHIWTSNLLPAEKMLLGEISALSTKTGWCDASREHFAAWLHCTLPNVSYFIQKLEKEGYLEVVRTPGYRSKMRVKANAFWVGEVNQIDGGSKRDLLGVVNQIDGGSKRDLLGVVNPIDGGSKRGLPEIQYKEKNKEREKEAPAPAQTPAVGGVSFYLEEKEKISLDIPPARAENSAAAGPYLTDYVNAQTPDEMLGRLRLFYATERGKREMEAIKSNTVAGTVPQDKFKQTFQIFAAWAVENGYGRKTFSDINARLRRWWVEEKNRQNTSTTAPTNQPRIAVDLPQTQIRYSK